jgi:hypothetical protein
MAFLNFKLYSSSSLRVSPFTANANQPASLIIAHDVVCEQNDFPVFQFTIYNVRVEDLDSGDKDVENVI